MGSFEYWNALNDLGELVTSSSSKELETYDKLISRRPEFSFHVGLAKMFWGDEVGFDAAKIHLDDDIKVEGGESLRTGLAWLIALARSELSASLSAFTDTDEPFYFLQPSDFDRRQYEILLYDDALGHLVSFSKDQNAQEVTQRNRMADSQTIDYLRRGRLVRDLIVAARQTSLNDVESDREWQSGYDDVKSKIRNLRDSIDDRLMTYSNVGRAPSPDDKVFMADCATNGLLEGERSGRNRVISRQRFPRDSGGRE